MVRVGNKPTRKSELKRTKKRTTSYTYQVAKLPIAKRSLPYIFLFLKISILYPFGNLAIWQLREINREVYREEPPSSPFNPGDKVVTSLSPLGTTHNVRCFRIQTMRFIDNERVIKKISSCALIHVLEYHHPHIVPIFQL